MGKVVPISRGQFLSDYIALQQRSDFRLADGLLLLGMLVTIVVPQALYCVYGGPVSPWLLVVSAQAGVIAGLVNYIRLRAPVQSILDSRTSPRNEPQRDAENCRERRKDAKKVAKEDPLSTTSKENAGREL